MNEESQQEILINKLDLCYRLLIQIAGDINNNLGQIAAAAKLRLNIMQLHPEENTQENIDEIKLMLSELIRGLQNIAGDKINTIILDLPNHEQ